MRKTRLEIYRSRRHLAATLCFVIAPFLFLLFFARLYHIATGKLFFDVSVSLSRLIIAYLIAAVLGWTFAVIFHRGRRAAIALPIFDVLQGFPTFAALPMAVLAWGPTNFTVIFFLVITVIWPLFFSVVSSLKLVRRDWEEVTQIYGLSGWNYLKNFLWPLSLPGLVTGSVIGLGDGWGALVATEIIVGIKSGVGNFFQSFSQNPAVTAFGILGLLIIIFSLNKIIWTPLLDLSHREMEE